MTNRLDRISCHCFIEVDGYAWFSNWFYNGLFRVELATGRTFFQGYFKEEEPDEFNLHWLTLYRKKRMYFIPRRGCHLHIYNPLDQSVCAVRMRKKGEEFFVVFDAVLIKDSLILIPYQENAPIRSIDLSTLHVRDLKKEEKEETLNKGIFLSKLKERFPNPELIKMYSIELEDRTQWQKASDGFWYDFMPLGCHLLRYEEDSNRIDRIPLMIVNEKELNSHIRRVGQAILKKGVAIEGEDSILSRFLKVMVNFDKIVKDSEEDIYSGERIWSTLKRQSV